MLASLLPGLRDVRTPLTVGYLWLVFIWLMAGDAVPVTRPAGEGYVARLFDLGTIVGRGSAVAVISFIAYLLGAVATVPLEGRFGSLLRRAPSLSIDTSVTESEFERHAVDIARRAASLDERLSNRPGTQEDRAALQHAIRDSTSGGRVALPDLRARLLVANQEMYGEYDRLVAEASFRINLVVPLLAFSYVIGSEFGLVWGIVTVAVAGILFIQGVNRWSQSTTVLKRAVVSGTVRLPTEVKVSELEAKYLGPDAARLA